MVSYGVVLCNVVSERRTAINIPLFVYVFIHTSVQPSIHPFIYVFIQSHPFSIPFQRMIRMVQVSHGDCMNVPARDCFQVPGKRVESTHRLNQSNASRVRIHLSQRRNSAPDAADCRWQRPAAQDELCSFYQTQSLSYSMSRPRSPLRSGSGSGSEIRSYWSEDSDQDPRPLKPTIEEMKAQRYNR